MIEICSPSLLQNEFKVISQILLELSSFLRQQIYLYIFCAVLKKEEEIKDAIWPEIICFVHKTISPSFRTHPTLTIWVKKQTFQQQQKSAYGSHWIPQRVYIETQKKYIYYIFSKIRLQVSDARCHASHVTCHVSPVTCQ